MHIPKKVRTTKRHQQRALSAAALLAAMCVTAATQLPALSQSHTTWYVSKKGNNTTGRTWDNAYSELNQINWKLVQSGDTIQIDGDGVHAIPLTSSSGGSTSTTLRPVKYTMTYVTPLVVPKTFVGSLYITPSSEFGHNGIPILSQPAIDPLVGTLPGSNSAAGIEVQATGPIYIGSQTKWNGIIIENYQVGVLVDPAYPLPPVAQPKTSGAAMFGAPQVTLVGLDINHCKATPIPTTLSSVSLPRGAAIATDAGANVLVRDCNLHDNLYGAVAYGGSNINIYHSWIRNSQWPGALSNSTGVVNVGGINGANVSMSILGPGLNCAVSDAKPTGVPSGIIFPTADLTQVSNCLIIDPANRGVSDSYSSNFNLSHITEFMTAKNAYGTSGDCFLDNQAPENFKVANSVVYGGTVAVPRTMTPLTVGLPTPPNDKDNTQYATTGVTSFLSLMEVNPQFVSDVSGYDSCTTLDQLIGTNFALKADSPAKGEGSAVTSVKQFFSAAAIATKP